MGKRQSKSYTLKAEDESSSSSKSAEKANKNSEENVMDFKVEKEKYLGMSVEEKQELLNLTVCGLDQIPTWAKYWESNKLKIAQTSGTKEPVEPSLAEKVSIWKGDITALGVDVIVNAANQSLLGGGGVDGAIHKAAGPALKMECKTLNGCEVGEAKITGGYKLPAKYVIHTVGPVGKKPEQLTECYQNSLALAVENGLRTIAFPCISTGVFGYPQKDAAEVAVSVVKSFLEKNQDKIDRIIFCVFLSGDKNIYEDLLQQKFALD